MGARLQPGNNASFRNPVFHPGNHSDRGGVIDKWQVKAVICRPARGNDFVAPRRSFGGLQAGGEGRYGAGAPARGHRKGRKLLGLSLIDVRPLKLSVEWRGGVGGGGGGGGGGC